MGVDASHLDAEPDGLEALGRFLDTVPVLDHFRDGVNEDFYYVVPDDWFVGTADVVGSTEAIRLGGYKAVNMVGAGVIAATMNATGTRDFPFVFGGDGATFVVPPGLAETARGALAAMRRWTTDETDLRLRAGLVPVSDIRKAGHDVRLALFAPNENVSYAMFAGGGLAWAEQAMKAGRHEVPRAKEGVRPDLEGLSCRWQPARAERGEVLSLIVVPARETDAMAYRQLETKVLDTVRGPASTDGHPLTGKNTRFSAFPNGLDLETRASAPPGQRLSKRIGLGLLAVFGWFLFRFKVPVGAFDPEQYRDDMRANSDFRKFDDGLKLTVDCTAETIEALNRLLDDAVASGIAHYGMHRQSSALVTCIVPSTTTRDHIHFVDGADGGYARAAEQLKEQRRAMGGSDD